jgi:hypothetical protein
MSSDPKAAWVQQHSGAGVKVLDELLQQQVNPVEWLKSWPDAKFVIVVPNEFSWTPELKPFTNPLHKQKYDAETFAEDLEAAGLVYAMKDVSFSGWSFLCAEASK